MALQARDKEGRPIRFMRKGGRVIPIRAGGAIDKYQSSREKFFGRMRKDKVISRLAKKSRGHKRKEKAAKIGGTAGIVGGAIGLAKGKSRLAKGIGAAGVAVGGALRGVGQSQKKKRLATDKEGMKQVGKRFGKDIKKLNKKLTAARKEYQGM